MASSVAAAVVNNIGQEVVDGACDSVSATLSGNRINDIVSTNRLEGLTAPAKRKEMGHPTTSREKAPYEGLSKRTRFCMICRKQGHKRTTCPDRGDYRSSRGSRLGVRIVEWKVTGGIIVTRQWILG